MAKHMSRQELREDPVQDFVMNLWAQIQERWQLIAIVALVVIAAAIAVTMMGNRRAEAERTSSGIWIRAQESVLVGDHATALELTGRLQDDFGGTRGGKKAILIEADALAGLDRTDEALTAYREAIRTLSSDPILHTSARRGLAVVQENAGEYAAAGEIYRELATSADPAGGRVFDLRAAARCEHRLGNHAEAIRLLDQLIERYENSTERVDIDAVHLARVSKAEWAHQTGN